MNRVIVYIDGFNLYYGLKAKGWKNLYWLNLQSMALHLLKPGQSLVRTKYFTSIVKQPADKNRRQAAFLDALRTLSEIGLFFGHYLSNAVICRHCGHQHTTHHEKMTDVNIAVELLTDAFQDSFDTALIVSADSDLLGPIKAVKRMFPSKRSIIVFPPNRNSSALRQTADGVYYLDPILLAKCTFPEQVQTASGYMVSRPVDWQ